MKKFLFFLLPVLIFAGCSSKKDADYKKEAEDNVRNGKISEAITAYDNLVKEFPDSKLAPAAIYETASLYQNNMVKNLPPKESLKKAAETFRKVFNKYPKSKEAPQALFNSGFIYANELKNFSAATETYNLFISKYPDHELSASAKFELDNMGVEPEDIISRKSNDNNESARK